MFCTSDSAPVSYTHLDVYKRQGHAHCSECAGDIGLGVAKVGSRRFNTASALVEGAAGCPVVGIGTREDLERLLGIPAGGLGQGAERLVIDLSLIHI